MGQAEQAISASKATTDQQLLSSRPQEGYYPALGRAPAQAEKTSGHRSTRHDLVRQAARAQSKGHSGWEMGYRQLGPRVLQDTSSKRVSVAAGRPMGALLWSAMELCWRTAELR